MLREFWFPEFGENKIYVWLLRRWRKRKGKERK